MEKIASQMKMSLFYLYGFIAFCFIVLVAFTSCSTSEDLLTRQNCVSDESLSSPVSIKEVTSIMESNPLLISLKMAPDITNLAKYLGVPDWSNARLITYTNSNMSAISVAMSKTRTLIAYAKANDNRFTISIVDVIPDTKIEASAGFTGDINFYLASGILREGGHFENDKLINTRNATNMRTSTEAPNPPPPTGGCDCLIMSIINPLRLINGNGVVMADNLSVYQAVCNRTCGDEV